MDLSVDCCVEVCDSKAMMYVESGGKYYCGYHFDERFEPYQGERLISPILAVNTIKTVDLIVKIFSTSLLVDLIGKPGENGQEFCNEIKLHMDEVKRQMNKAIETKSLHEFADLRTRAKNLQAIVNDEESFKDFAIKWLWRCSEESIKEKPIGAMGIDDLREYQSDKLQEEIKKKDLAIENLEEENKTLYQEIEQLKQRHDRGIQDEVLLSYSDFNLHYKNITREALELNPESRLTLSLNDPNHLACLVDLPTKMPDIDKLDLKKIPGDSQEIKSFLRNKFPNKVRVLNFNWQSEINPSMDFYMRELVTISKNVLKQFFIYKFEISQPNLIMLLSVCKKKTWIGFITCKLKLASVPNFGGRLSGSTIYGIDLNSCGKSEYGDWENNQMHFDNLMNGLSQENDLKNSLKKIKMTKCGLEADQVTSILLKYGFRDDTISSYSK
ncbi:unnamed protein product [Moneuplotes crassus]|uniref:Uncharacterized protein n=1 Tax=Euplotes crassus TaxID=5936 RepID=A0AAD1U1S8_EUPCR|nr:unnamed protein product [Moneuplotes crassus]